MVFMLCSQSAFATSEHPNLGVVANRVSGTTGGLDTFGWSSVRP